MSDQPDSVQTPARTRFFRGPLEKHAPAPLTEWVSFWLLLASGVVSLAELVVLVIVRLGDAAAPSLTGALIAACLGVAITVALRVYVAFAVLRGYGPVRMYLSVVGALVIVVTFTGGVDVFGGLLVALIVASVVLVWLPVSNRYFTAVTAARNAATPPQRG